MTGILVGVVVLLAWEVVDAIRHRREERIKAQRWATALREHLAEVNRIETVRQAWILERYRSELRPS